VTATYNELVGGRLRSIRRQRGLSLQDVQRLSNGEFKAAVVGAYERGERSLSLPRLQRLSQFFQVPISQFMPQDESGVRTMEPLPSGGVTIDLGCHDVDKKKVGPAFKDVAAKYKGDKKAEASLVAKLKEGKGHLKIAASDAELKAAVRYALGAK